MIKDFGKHRVRLGYVEQGLDDLMQGQLADLFYCDPPWGNLKYWQTLNQKMTGAEKQEVDLNKTLETIFLTANKYSKNLCFVEYGIKWKDELIEAAKKIGYTSLGVATPLYKAGSKLLPQHLHIFAKTPIVLPPGYIESINNTMGLELLEKAVLPFAQPNMIILDSYCGLGTTARFAVKHNLIFYGNEMNGKRILKTYEKLS